MAYRSGNLAGSGQTQFQRWALAYYQFSEKREMLARHFEFKNLLHLILRGTNDKLYDLAFPRVEVDDPDVDPSHTYGVEDLEDLEKLLGNIDGLITKTQASLDSSIQWSEWR